MKYSLSDISKMANETHKSLELQDASFVNPAEIADSLGFRVVDVDFEEEENIMGMVFSDENAKAILISKDADEDEQRFITAHEIGHIVLHHSLNDSEADYVEIDFYSSSNDPLDEKETEANYFAAALLIPENSAKTIWNKLKDVDDFSKFFAVSKRIASQRLMMLELI